MPLTAINLTIEDSDLDKYTITVYKNMGYSVALGDWETDTVEFLWDTIRPLIDGVLTKATSTVEHFAEGFTNNIVDVLSDNQERAKFTFRNYYVEPILTLPTFKEGLFTNSGAGKVVDITDTDVAAFIAVMTDGGGFGAMDKHGTTIDFFVKAEQAWGK